MSRTAKPLSDLASDSGRTGESDEQSVTKNGIGERLRTIRSHSSQVEFAGQLEVSTKTYGLWERSDRSPDAEALTYLAKQGWNINWLLTGEGPERLDALNQSGSVGPGMQPEMMQKAVESAIGVFQRFNKMPNASQLARASVLLYLMFTDTEPDPTAPVDQLLAKIVSEPVES